MILQPSPKKLLFLLGWMVLTVLVGAFTFAMMNRPVEQATLTDFVRRTVETMEPGEAGYVTSEAVRVGEDRKLWVDSSSPVSRGYSSRWEIRVRRTSTGVSLVAPEGSIRPPPHEGASPLPAGKLPVEDFQWEESS